MLGIDDINGDDPDHDYDEEYFAHDDHDEYNDDVDNTFPYCRFP